MPAVLASSSGKHALFVRVELDGTVIVVRILHAAMLPELHLPNADKDR